MNTLTQFLGENGPTITLVLLSAVFVLTLMVIALSIHLKKLRRTWGELMRGQNGLQLDAMLQEHLQERRALQQKVDALDQKASTLERKMSGSLRYSGMVRYDAFEDVGATQSWSLALYDEQGNGAVISCLYGRTDCRVYSKILENGKADRSLTGEEQAAIEAAARGGRTVVKA